MFKLCEQFSYLRYVSNSSILFDAIYLQLKYIKSSDETFDFWRTQSCSRRIRDILPGARTGLGKNKAALALREVNVVLFDATYLQLKYIKSSKDTFPIWRSQSCSRWIRNILPGARTRLGKNKVALAPREVNVANLAKWGLTTSHLLAWYDTITHFKIANP